MEWQARRYGHPVRASAHDLPASWPYSQSYGTPVKPGTKKATGAVSQIDTESGTMLARWADTDYAVALYRSSYAMVFPGVEDFGIVMAEAQACGTPVIATAAGGALDIVEPGRTGWLLADPSVESIRAAVIEAVAEPFAADTIAAAAGRFSSARFRTEMRDVVDAVLSHG